MDGLNAELALIAQNDQLERHVTQLRDVLYNALRLVRMGAWGTTCDACGAKPGKPCYGNGPMAIGHQGRNDKSIRELEEILAEACDVL